MAKFYSLKITADSDKTSVGPFYRQIQNNKRKESGFFLISNLGIFFVNDFN
jgi:hypothetical protein